MIIIKYPNKAGIYKLTCLVNGKNYIGKSINIDNRIKQHKRCSNNSKNICYFQNAIIKHGWDAFEVEILEVFDNFDKLKDNSFLLERETYYIELFDTTNRDKGYNRCSHSSDRTGLKCSEETKEKMRQAKLGKPRKPFTEETKEKMRKPKSEEHIKKIRDRVFSEETKSKMSLSSLGKPKSEEHKAKLRKPKYKRKIKLCQTQMQNEIETKTI